MRVTGSRLQRSDRPPRPLLALWLFDEMNRIGVGDAAPLPGFSRESIDACARALTGVEDRLGAIDDDARPAEAISAALARFDRDLDAVPAARLALETALFDLVGLRRGSPRRLPRRFARAGARPRQRSLARAAGRDAGRSRRRARRPRLLRDQDQARARDEAGFLRELAALREVRIASVALRDPPRPQRRVGPGRGPARLRALAVIAPAFVEQPVEATLLHRLGECAVPWAADESLLIPELVEPLPPRAAARPSCSSRPSSAASIARALALRAQARGIDVVVTHLFDGPYSMAAAAELALSLPRPPLACGLDRHDALEAWIADHGGLDIPQLAEPGWIQSSGGPGLGVSGYPIEHTWTR